MKPICRIEHGKKIYTELTLFFWTLKFSERLHLLQTDTEVLEAKAFKSNLLH